MYPKIPLAQSIITICQQKGVQHIVISPGSRNAPLTIGFTNNPYYKCFSIADERCAAFFALFCVYLISLLFVGVLKRTRARTHTHKYILTHMVSLFLSTLPPSLPPSLRLSPTLSLFLSLFDLSQPHIHSPFSQRRCHAGRGDVCKHN